jgi:2-polyprenyl-3-methyl-5-hydroxy-6-metoxy-1,4-benzoquinol methylase
MPSITANPARRACIERIATRFASRWHQGYARGKLKLDPVFDDAVEWARRAAASVSPASILDAGCGLGLLAHWLREHDVGIPVHGVDSDAPKIEAARAAAVRGALSAVDFATSDVRSAVGGGSVFLIDVLHYLSLPDRADLLSRIAANVPARGVVYIRNGLGGKSWRHGITRLEEWFAHVSGWLPGRRFPLPDESEIGRHFPEAQFERTIGPLWGRTPFNSFRLAFVKR